MRSPNRVSNIQNSHVRSSAQNQNNILGSDERVSELKESGQGQDLKKKFQDKQVNLRLMPQSLGLKIKLERGTKNEFEEIKNTSMPKQNKNAGFQLLAPQTPDDQT